jgi:hypothetical protein
MTKPMSPLRQRMIEDMQVRNLSLHTQRAYIDQVSRFARYFGRSPATLGSEDIRTYQIYLVNERRLASSSIQIAIAALRFLYRVTLKKEWAFAEVIPSPKAATAVAGTSTLAARRWTSIARTIGSPRSVAHAVSVATWRQVRQSASLKPRRCRCSCSSTACSLRV